jgi:peptide/nickel transport system substrate-binding protein
MRLHIRAAVTLAVFSLVACGSQTTPAPGLSGIDQGLASKEDVNRVDRSAVQDGGELKWPIDQLPDNWNTFQVNGSAYDGSTMIAAVMPRMFVQRADATTVENLDYVQSVQLTSTEPQVVTYRLNPKARWSDGTTISGRTSRHRPRR